MAGPEDVGYNPYNAACKKGYDLLPENAPCRKCPNFDGAESTPPDRIKINCEGPFKRVFIHINPNCVIVGDPRVPCPRSLMS